MLLNQCPGKKKDQRYSRTVAENLRRSLFYKIGLSTSWPSQAKNKTQCQTKSSSQCHINIGTAHHLSFSSTLYHRIPPELETDGPVDANSSAIWWAASSSPYTLKGDSELFEQPLGAVKPVGLCVFVNLGRKLSKVPRAGRHERTGRPRAELSAGMLAIISGLVRKSNETHEFWGS